MVLFRGGSIRAFNSLKFDASEVSSAFKSFSTKGRVSKVAVSFEDDQSLIKVSKYQILIVFRVLTVEIGTASQI